MDLRAHLYTCERKKVEQGSWSTFFAGVNVWKSEDLPGRQKAQITAIKIDCYQISFSFLETGESEIVEREGGGALASLASAESAWVFLVMNWLHLGF